MSPLQVGVTSPPDLDELRTNIHSALERIDTDNFIALLLELGVEMPAYLASHLGVQHSIPSPSSLSNCATALWYEAKDVEPDPGKVIPPAWRKRTVAGSILEPFWFTILKMAGLDVRLADKSVQCGPHMTGSPDAYIGEDGLLELKDLTGWTYKRLLEGQGVAFEEPRYYTQIQQYLGGTGREWCLFFASTPDPAFFQSILRRYKKYGPQWECPLMYMEIVYARQVDIDAGIARSEMIVDSLTMDDPPEREHDGKVNWPCSYCQFQKRCQEAFG